MMQEYAVAEGKIGSANLEDLNQVEEEEKENLPIDNEVEDDTRNSQIHQHDEAEILVTQRARYLVVKNSAVG